MPRKGYIREKKDIKFLILYALERVPFPVSEPQLIEICLQDEAFGYLEFAEAFYEMVKTAHVSEIKSGKDKLYEITEKGRYALSAFESLLPRSVREDIEKAVSSVIYGIKREKGINTSIVKTKNGYYANLSLTDGSETMMAITLYTATKSRAIMLERNFKKNAESIYNAVLKDLTMDFTDEPE